MVFEGDAQINDQNHLNLYCYFQVLLPYLKEWDASIAEEGRLHPEMTAGDRKMLRLSDQTLDGLVMFAIGFPEFCRMLLVNNRPPGLQYILPYRVTDDSSPNLTLTYNCIIFVSAEPRQTRAAFLGTTRCRRMCHESDFP